MPSVQTNFRKTLYDNAVVNQHWALILYNTIKNITMNLVVRITVMKEGKKRTEKPPKEVPNKPSELMLKNAIYVTNAFHLAPNDALNEINNGMLGYKVDKEGEYMLDKKNKEKIPLTIGRTKFFELKSKFAELPEAYSYLKKFAMNGYTNLVIGFQEELAVLHRMSHENLKKVTDPLERQQIIKSLIIDVIPTESGFADMLKSIIEDNKEITEGEKDPEETPPEETEKI